MAGRAPQLGHDLLSAYEPGAGPRLLCGDPRRDGSRDFPGPPRSAPVGEPQGAVWGLAGSALGLVALLLAFGLSLAVSRYEDRRSNIVTEANTIGTTYLRAQTLAEPIRRRSLDLLVRYTRTAVRLSDETPGSAGAEDARALEERIQRRLWGLAGEALDMAPTASAPRLYVETLNEMIDAETVRVAALSNRVPTAVLVLELLGSALALGLLAAYLAIVGRGVFAVLLASALVASMEDPPAATAPRSRAVR